MMVEDEDVDRKRLLLGRVSVIEAISYLVLLVAAIVKRTQGSELGVEIMGPIHGLLYLTFALLVLLYRSALGWTLVRTVLALFLGALPFGGFWVDRRWVRPAEPSSRSAVSYT